MRQAAPYAKQFSSACFFRKCIMQMTEPRQSHAEGQRVHTVCNLKQQTCITYKIKHLSYLGLMGAVCFILLSGSGWRKGREDFSAACCIYLRCMQAQLAWAADWSRFHSKRSMKWKRNAVQVWLEVSWDSLEIFTHTRLFVFEKVAHWVP